MATDTGSPAVRSGQGAWAGGDRLPVAPRQRRPALAALALLLILGGGLISAVLVLRSGEKEAVIVLNRTVAAGQVIERGDLAQGQIAGLPEGTKVPWGDASRVVGLTALSELRRGSVLHRESVDKVLNPGAGQVAVGLALKPDQLPAGGLRVGDHVKVYYAPSSSGGAVVNGPKFIPPADGILVRDAFVLERGPSRQDGTVTITVVVKDSESLVLYQQARLQAIALGALPKKGG